MAIKVEEILGLLDKIIQLEGLIETELKRVSDVKKRKAIRDAIKNRDADALRRVLFD